MKGLIIFGVGSIAQLAHYYFTGSSTHDVVCFTVTRNFYGQDSFLGLPVVCFEELDGLYPPSKYEIFVAIGYSKLNKERERIYNTVKEMGYSCPSYISDRATVLNGGCIGDNCLILEDNTIQPLSKVGNNAVMWSGNHIGHHSIVRDSCFITSHVVISGHCEIGERCFLGVNSTLRDGITVGHDTLIGAGSLLLNNVEPYGVYSEQETVRSRVPSSRMRSI